MIFQNIAWSSSVGYLQQGDDETLLNVTIEVLWSGFIHFFPEFDGLRGTADKIKSSVPFQLATELPDTFPIK